MFQFTRVAYSDLPRWDAGFGRPRTTAVVGPTASNNCCNVFFAWPTICYSCLGYDRFGNLPQSVVASVSRRNCPSNLIQLGFCNRNRRMNAKSDRTIRLSPELSQKLKVISLVSIFLVLCNHAKLDSQNGLNFEAIHPGVREINSFITAATRLNRVLFFGVAGFLFALGGPLSGANLVRKWGSRLRSLVIPYLLFLAIIALAQFLAANLLPSDFVQRSPMLAPTAAAGGSFWRVLASAHGTGAQHLWFLEALIGGVFGLGAILHLCAWNRGVQLILLLATAGTFIWSGSAYLEGFTFFLAGTLLARTPELLEKAQTSLRGILLLAVTWAGLLAAYLHSAPAAGSNPLFILIRLVQSTVGAVLVWKCYNLLGKWWRERLLRHADYTFPIYCLHMPVILGLCRHAYLHLIPQNNVAIGIGCLPIAVFAFFLSLWLAKLLERLMPRFARVAFGDRGGYRRAKEHQRHDGTTSGSQPQ